MEKRLCKRISAPRDFDFLSEELAASGKKVSSTTLKRIWGYNRDISDTYIPYRYTVEALVKLLGYNSIEDYLKLYNGDDVQSAVFLGQTIMAENIEPGRMIELTWEPDRLAMLKCMRSEVFEVIRSENGRLQCGDVVTFKSLTQNAPAYFNEVKRPGSNISFIYTAGQRTGIRYRILDAYESAFA
ncbi:MAG: hypothetical protein K2K97_03105 [Muribaculaceae bacterium]|nr:hypothetical protein [Muribaculaceae bacterium]